jgi:hypothetical protein
LPKVAAEAIDAIAVDTVCPDRNENFFRATLFIDIGQDALL